MTAPASHPALAIPQASLQAMVPQRPTPMRVSLAFVEHRVNVYLRFGQPVRENLLDRWRRVAVFAPGAVCCRVKWIGNDYGTALWQLMVLEAPMPFDGAQRIAGVAPGARILLRSAQERPAYLDAIRIGPQRQPLREAFRFMDEVADALQPQDRVHTYAGFVIADVPA